MGGKGGTKSTNDQMVQMQMQQSQQAAEANAERNARLTSGAQEIKQMFEGRPGGSQLVDLSGIASGAVAPGAAGTRYGGWVAVADPGGGAHWAQSDQPGLPSGYSYSVMPDSGSGAPSYGLYGPQGLITTATTPQELAKAQVYTGGDPSTTEGGFQQPFYDKYTNAILGAYLPQESQQYADAQSSLGYTLARAGTLNSTIGDTDRTKLQLQDQINKAQIASQAQTQTGQLRNTVQQDEQTALNQLYSTEDPSVAANTAGNMVANAQLQVPDINPLGALFQPIMAGIGNAISGYTNPYAYISQGAGMGQTPSGQSGSGQPRTGY
jgi:hypothetical protein